jgi:DNA-binding response OmpR family regulator
MKNILLIDDEQDVLSSLGAFLRRSGYHVWAADTGTEGLKIAKRETLDLIILDLILPDKDGSDVAAELLNHRDTCNIPIIFLTSMVRKTEQETDGPMVANRCILAKPCRPEEILALVTKHIGSAS